MSDTQEHGAKATMGSHPQLVEVTDHAKLLEQPEKAKMESGEGAPYYPPNGYWPLVVIAGRYGLLGCQNTQTLRYNNILRSTALEEGKKWFGLCPRVINYYDEQGHLIQTE